MSKNKIFYFSGTGNSLYISKKIKEKLKDCEIIRITSDLVTNEISDNIEYLGFIYPVYAHRPPHLINKFIKKIKKLKADYIFTIAVHGGGLINSSYIMKKMLQAKGLSVNAEYEITTPGNYIKSSKIDSFIIAKQIENIDINLDKIVNMIINKSKNSIPVLKDLKSLIKSSKIYLFYKTLSYNFNKFFYLNNNCNGCGICVKICPVKNIDFINNKPIWSGKCHYCMGCINWCPKKAIYYFKEDFNSNLYHNPKINYSDFF